MNSEKKETVALAHEKLPIHETYLMYESAHEEDDVVEEQEQVDVTVELTVELTDEIADELTYCIQVGGG